MRTGKDKKSVKELKGKRKRNYMKGNKKNKSIKHKISRNKAKAKMRKRTKPIAFFKKIKVPGRSNTLLVTSRDLQDQIDFLYLGKSYHLSMKQIMQYVGRTPNISNQK